MKRKEFEKKDNQKKLVQILDEKHQQVPIL